MDTQIATKSEKSDETETTEKPEKTLNWCEPCRKNVHSDFDIHLATITHQRNKERMPTCTGCNSVKWYVNRKRKECRECYDAYLLSQKIPCDLCNERHMDNERRSNCMVNCDNCYEQYMVDMYLSSGDKQAKAILTLQNQVKVLEERLTASLTQLAEHAEQLERFSRYI